MTMQNHNVIGFSHDYVKLYGQKYGTLISVKLVDVDDVFPPKEGLEYDTEYVDLKDINGCYRMERGRYIQLTFMGNKEIPFTTYRKCCPIPFNDCNTALLMLKNFYIGQPFAFKFKGMDIDDDVLKSTVTDQLGLPIID